MLHVELDRILCVGCTACATICPREAISMQQTTEGFFAPLINEKLCIECGKCAEVCPTKRLKIVDMKNGVIG